MAILGESRRPVIRVIIDDQGNFEILGKRSNDTELELMQLIHLLILSIGIPQDQYSYFQSICQRPDRNVGVLQTPGCDTDGDGYLDLIDFDSDGDGCTDANEYYRDGNADGGDDGYYGVGTPVPVDANGQVLARPTRRV